MTAASRSGVLTLRDPTLGKFQLNILPKLTLYPDYLSTLSNCNHVRRGESVKNVNRS
jgi:hypothetical protein